MLKFGNRRFLVIKESLQKADFAKSLSLFEEALALHPNASFDSNEIEYWGDKDLFARSFVGIPHIESESFYSVDKSDECYFEHELESIDQYDHMGILVFKFVSSVEGISFEFAVRRDHKEVAVI